MKENSAEAITACMAVSKDAYHVQKGQTEHRIKLADFWDIKAGSKILEIGCGQGDTTAVLAYYTGENGFIQGIDIASPTYGSPVSLGESADYLMQSKLGKQIKIDFNIDVLSPEVNFPKKSFDYIVFSHCAWYTKSADELLHILLKARTWGNQLCFAEWSTNIAAVEQYPHLLSILIQAQYESFKQNSESNVRTLMTPQDLRWIAGQAGWKLMEDATINSADLQDGKWEAETVLSGIECELSEIKNMPDKLKDLIRSEVLMLESFMESSEIKPLSVYCFKAL